MPAPLIHLNGPPGVGKLTIGRHLAPMIGARLLDNHSVYGVAFALTEFRSPEFYETVRAVRNLAYARILSLPPSVSVIFTGADFEDSDWGQESWNEVLALATRRGGILLAVHLSCDPAEHRRRIVTEGRIARGKLSDPTGVEDLSRRRLAGQGAAQTLNLDITQQSADRVAGRIVDWLSSNHLRPV